MFAIHQHVGEDVHEGPRSVVRRPLCGAGEVTLTAVAPYVKVQAVRGHPRASVGVLFGLMGWMSLRPRSRVPVVCNKLTRTSRHPGWSLGLCSRLQ